MYQSAWLSVTLKELTVQWEDYTQIIPSQRVRGDSAGMCSR